MRKTFAAVTIVTAFMLARPAQGAAAEEVPWWRQEKIRFLWGVWGLHGADTPGVNYYEREVPRRVFRNIALAGATVFVDTWFHKPIHARRAKEFGLRYFAGSHVGQMHEMEGGRAFVNMAGAEIPRGESVVRCPLDEELWARWLADETRRESIRAGLIDGLHTDWEAPDPGVCYCDGCFAEFLARQGLDAELPPKPDRFAWLQQRDLVAAYQDRESFSQRRFDMFTRIRKELHGLKPDLMFSAYGLLISDYTRAMHTPEAPFLYLDSRHYCNDDRQPWWESYSARIKQEGYLCIPGGWTNALFGSQPSQVSAARWLYEAAVNEDGVWIWFEHELDDEFLRAYSTADSDLKAAETAVGRFLLRGERLLNFVTAVEWTGRPDLEQACISRSYGQDNEFLAHISNVHTEWPLRVRVRFPRLPAGRDWTVQDALRRRYYARSSGAGERAVWSSAELLGGIVVPLAPRSDCFLVITPAADGLELTAAQTMFSREADALPDHEAAGAAVLHVPAAPVPEPLGIWGEPLDLLLSTTETLAELPRDGWLFRWDQADQGLGAAWFAPETAADSWEPIEVGRFWADQGGTGGPGWYRTAVTIPEPTPDRRVYLYFEAVDEEAIVWIDGRRVGEYDRGPAGWDQPFALDVSGDLTGGRHDLAVRVYNSAAAGGIWKPVRVLTGPAALEGPPADQVRQLVYTATDSMGFGLWHSGVKSIIANTIRTIESNGENATLLRQLRGQLWAPAYAPDGRRIVFVHDAGGRGQIYVMNEDGSGAANLSDNGFCERSPVWAPDGAKIAFLSDRTGDWDLYVMNADGSAQEHLAGNPGLDRAPAWSPDGKRIAWESHASGIPAVWVCDADGGNAGPLLAPDAPLTVAGSAVGQDEVFSFSEGDLPFRDNTVYLTNPVWSPDGTLIAAVGLGGFSGEMVVVLSADGRHMWPVIKWISGVDGKVTWSPDGTRLAGGLRTAPQETERSGIFVVNINGKGQYRWLVDVTPQGPRLGGAQRAGLVTWYSHGSAEPRRVLKSFFAPMWLPDGETIAFSADLGVTGAFHIYTVAAAGGEPQRLAGTGSAWPNQFMWRPEPAR